MVVRIMDEAGEWKLADFNEQFCCIEPEPPEFDFFGTCPKCMWGRNPVYNPKTNEWEVAQ